MVNVEDLSLESLKKIVERREQEELNQNERLSWGTDKYSQMCLYDSTGEMVLWIENTDPSDIIEICFDHNQKYSFAMLNKEEAYEFELDEDKDVVYLVRRK